MIVAGNFWATRTPLRRTAETDFSRGIAVVETEEGLVNAGGSFSAFADVGVNRRKEPNVRFRHSQTIEWTDYRAGGLQHMRIDHRRLQTAMLQE